MRAMISIVSRVSACLGVVRPLLSSSATCMSASPLPLPSASSYPQLSACRSMSRLSPAFQHRAMSWVQPCSSRWSRCSGRETRIRSALM